MLQISRTRFAFRRINILWVNMPRGNYILRMCFQVLIDFLDTLFSVDDWLIKWWISINLRSVLQNLLFLWSRCWCKWLALKSILQHESFGIMCGDRSWGGWSWFSEYLSIISNVLSVFCKWTHVNLISDYRQYSADINGWWCTEFLHQIQAVDSWLFTCKLANILHASQVDWVSKQLMSKCMSKHNLSLSMLAE